MTRTAVSLFAEAIDYQIDLGQRALLFADILRERAENALAHEEAGLPALLAFPYEMVLDAREFKEPANYALVRIKSSAKARKPAAKQRALIIVDPRAGHGPGIGGFKEDSEVGMAIREGYLVYFVIFFPQPCAGQTLAHVHHALRRFVAEVARRHPSSPPILYGNCQAGWAVVLLSADCVGTAGPAVLNGSPLSYWSGEAGVNPMRLAGGLSGGTWAAHWLADSRNGVFDGAWLALNFELLNLAHSLWDKNYHVFANVDTERERFLQFERWWSGFHDLSRDEILTVVENLFIGNKLEQGLVRICQHCIADLRRIRNPLLIFASSGDNITPPQQALSWIPAVYKSTEDLKSAGQRIVYLLHPDVGHLGIFVSSSVARREHRAILRHVQSLEDLRPGLYEMHIRGAKVTFMPRRVEDLKRPYPERAFERVRALSELNELAYTSLVSPFVRAAATPWPAEMLRWLHPMRISRYAHAERFNPWMACVKSAANAARAKRLPAPAANPYRQMEAVGSALLSSILQGAQAHRDLVAESLFAALFGEPPGIRAAAMQNEADG
jgi:hypothetical protein